MNLQEKADVLDGFIVIDKPKGPTSHQIDHWVREILGISKVGHIGTLDPGASGVLVMALGKATKLIDIAHEQQKEYVSVMRLYGDVPRERIEEVFREYEAELYQIPPMRSAVARLLRKRRVYSLRIMEITGRLVLFRVRCDSGTYIRTLCTDMGYTMGTGAQMAELKRTETGLFKEENAVTLQDLRDAVALKKEGKPEMFNRMFFASDYLFRDYSKVIVKKSTLYNISHGSDLFPGGIRAIIGKPMRGDRVAVLSENNELVGTGRMLVGYDEINDIKVVDFDRIMLENPDQGKVVIHREIKPRPPERKAYKPKVRSRQAPPREKERFRERPVPQRRENIGRKKFDRPKKRK